MFIRKREKKKESFEFMLLFYCPHLLFSSAVMALMNIEGGYKRVLLLMNNHFDGSFEVLALLANTRIHFILVSIYLNAFVHDSS